MQFEIGNNIKFDLCKFKKGEMHYYKFKKIFFNLYRRKLLFTLILGYKSSEINLGDMRNDYKKQRYINNKYPRNFTYNDIVKLGEFHKSYLNFKIVEKSYLEELEKLP